MAEGLHIWLLSSVSGHDVATEILVGLMIINERGVNVTPREYR